MSAKLIPINPYAGTIFARSPFKLQEDDHVRTILPEVYVWAGFVFLETTVIPLFIYQFGSLFCQTHCWWGVGLLASLGAWWLGAVCSMLKCQLTDPGVVPHSQNADELSMARMCSGGRFRPILAPPEHIFVRRWCRTCHVYRPCRASHCSVCDRCVQAKDHHCPYLKACIGVRNHRVFFFMLVYNFVDGCLLVFCALFAAFTLRPANWATHWLICCLFLIAAFMAIYFSGNLLYMQYTVISRGKLLKDMYRNDQNEQNPFDLGFKQNWFLFFFSPTLPSFYNYVPITKVIPADQMRFYKNAKETVIDGSYTKKSNEISQECQGGYVTTTVSEE